MEYQISQYVYDKLQREIATNEFDAENSQFHRPLQTRGGVLG